MVTYVNFLTIWLIMSFLAFSQGVYTQWHIPKTSGNSFTKVEYLDASDEIMLVSKHHFNRTHLPKYNLTQKLTFKGECTTSSLSRDGFIVAACDSGFIYTSTNAGESWNIFELPEPLVGVSICRANNDDIYAAMNDGKLYLSTDDGINFTLLSTLPRNGIPSITVTNNGTLLSGFRGTSRGLFRSTNQGQSWQTVDDTLYIHDLRSFSGSDTILGSQSRENSSSINRLMLSTNHGLTWTKNTTDGAYSGIHYFITPSFVVLYSGMVLEYTTDCGTSWIRVLNGNIPEAVNWISAAFKDTTNGIVVGTRGTILTASVSIKNWTKVNGAKTHAGGVLGFIKTSETPSKFKIVTYETTNVTTDEGETWTSEAIIAKYKIFRQYDGVYVGLSHVYYSNPFGRSAAKVSTDGGMTFTTVYGDSSEMVLGFARFNSERAIVRRQPLYIWPYYNRFTTDGGLTWPLETDISFNDNIFKVGEWRAITANNIQSISFLSDYGKTIFTLNTQFPVMASVNSLAAPSDSVAFIVSNKGYIVKLDTKKRTLISSTNPLPLNFNYVDFRNNYGFVVADRGFLLYTTDTGDSWKVLRTVAENKLIQVYFDNDSTAFAVDEFGGIIKIGFSYTTDINQQVESAVPDQFTLEQNYPNPFNNSTIIKYSIPVAGNVKLTVYDINGKIVSAPVNGHHQPGMYQISLDAGNLSSGIYFYLLDIGTKRITKKLILLK